MLQGQPAAGLGGSENLPGGFILDKREDCRFRQ